MAQPQLPKQSTLTTSSSPKKDAPEAVCAPSTMHWCVVDPPAVQDMSGVALTGPDDLWTTSRSYLSANLNHWNGTTWQAYTVTAILQAVAARDSTNVWAVGTSPLAPDGSSPYVARWVGTGWSSLPTQNPPTTTLYYNKLFAASMLSNNDVWAVGSSMPRTTDFLQATKTLIQHCTPTSCAYVPSPNRFPNKYNALFGVSAVSTTNIWAVGSESSEVGNGGYGLRNVPTILHYDGSTWTAQPTNYPYDPLSSSAYLYDVDFASSSDIWAVGQLLGQGISRPLIYHYDGTSWQILSNVPAPPNAVDPYLYDVAVNAANDVWAVGTYSKPNQVPNLNRPTLNTPSKITTPKEKPDAPFGGSGQGDEDGATKTLVLHWDGTSWQIVDSESPGAGSTLVGVATAPRDQSLRPRPWAVGAATDRESSYGIVETISPLRANCGPSSLNSEDPMGDDNYQFNFSCLAAGQSSLTGQAGISRYYGVLQDSNALTGTIGTATISRTVATTATLAIHANGITSGERITATLNGYAHVLANSGDGLLTAAVPITELILPRKGTLTASNGVLTGATAPPTATNYLTLTRTNTAATWTQLSVSLRVHGLRPLILQDGFNPDQTTPDHYLELGQPSRWWSTSLLDQYLPGIRNDFAHVSATPTRWKE